MKRVVLSGIATLFAMVIVAAYHPLSFGAQVQDTAPEFTLTDLRGVRHTLSEYRGKVVVINFWASWCRECTEELPSLVTLYEKFRRRGLVVLGITTDQKRDPVDPLLKKYQVTYPVILNTAGGQLLKQYGVIGLPSTVVIDRKGVIAERSIGRTDFGSPAFTNRIESLINSAINKR